MPDVERALTFIESMKVGVEWWSNRIPQGLRVALLADLDILRKMLEEEEA